MSEASHDNRPPRPAPVGRSLLLLVVAFASSVLLTGWIRAGFEQPFLGRVRAHRQPIVAATDGRVAEWIADVGTEVRAGDSIARLEDEALRGRIDEAAETVERLSAELNRAEARADVEVAWRVDEIDRQILAAELKATDLVRQRVEARIAQLVTSSDESDRGIVTPVAIEDSQRARYGHLAALLQNERSRSLVEVVDAQRELCEHRLAALRTLRERLPADVRTAHGVDGLAGQLAGAESEARALADAATARVVPTPGFGCVDDVRVRRGDAVRDGDTLAMLVDRSRTYIEVPVPSRQLETLAPETAVRVLFPNGEKREGVVTATEPTPVVRRAEQHDPTAEAYFLIRVTPVGKLWPELPLGSNVEVQPAG